LEIVCLRNTDFAELIKSTSTAIRMRDMEEAGVYVVLSAKLPEMAKRNHLEENYEGVALIVVYFSRLIKVIFEKGWPGICVEIVGRCSEKELDTILETSKYYRN